MEQAFKNEFTGVGKTGLRRPQNMSGEELLEWVLENKAHIDSNTGCWIWDGVVQNKGRPMIFHEKKNHLLYRLSWEVYNQKPFPKGLQAGHICEHKSPDHKRCFNPHHVKPMTQQENELSKPNLHCDEYKEKQRQHQLTRTSPTMPAGLTHKERVDWLLENAYEEDDNGCFIYQGQIGKDGYGRRGIHYKEAEGSQSAATTKDGKKKVEMHRYIYFVLNDLDYCNPPKGMVVHHTCTNRACGNPDHLELVTRSQNLKATRTYAASTTITAESVAEICHKWVKEGHTYPSKTAFVQEQMDKYNVGKDCIRLFLFRGRTWKDVAQPILQAKNSS